MISGEAVTPDKARRIAVSLAKSPASMQKFPE
jgi:hypothetical protein